MEWNGADTRWYSGRLKSGRESTGRCGVAILGKAMGDTDKARSISIMPFDIAYVPKLSITNALTDEYSYKTPPFPIPFHRSMRTPSLYRGFSLL